MSPLTRVEAMKKMEAFKVKIGFPDKWIDYSTFKVEKGQALKNFYASNAFGFQLDLNRCVYMCIKWVDFFIWVCIRMCVREGFPFISIPFHLISFHFSLLIFFTSITTPFLCEHFFYPSLSSPRLTSLLPFPILSPPYLTSPCPSPSPHLTSPHITISSSSPHHVLLLTYSP